jgi:hypothetical protein
LRAYGNVLGERVINHFPPLHGAADPIPPLMHCLKRRPFPAQTIAIMGIAKRWQEARCAAAVAECGTGKTLISLGSVFTHADGRPFTALAMVPPQLVEKWARECFLTLPGVRVFMIDGVRNAVGSNGFTGVNEVRSRNGRVVREGLKTTLASLVMDDPLQIGECFFESIIRLTKTELQEIAYQLADGELRRRLEATLKGEGWEINGSAVRFAIINNSTVSGARLVKGNHVRLR